MLRCPNSSPKCQPRRPSANHSEFVGSRPRNGQGTVKERPQPLRRKTSAKNRNRPTIHVSSPDKISVDGTGTSGMPFLSFVRSTRSFKPPMSESPASPARHLKLSGASNFRDLGGYPASDGRTVRWRQIFRSNHLGHLTDDDISVLRELGVRSAFDFRGTEERAAALCGMPEISFIRCRSNPRSSQRCAPSRRPARRCRRTTPSR